MLSSLTATLTFADDGTSSRDEGVRIERLRTRKQFMVDNELVLRRQYGDILYEVILYRIDRTLLGTENIR